MLKRPASMQARLLLLVTATSLVVWTLAAVLTWRDARHELDELLDGHLAQAAALLIAQSASGEEAEAPDAPVLHRYAPKVAFQVFHEGRLTQRSANAPADAMVRGGAQLQGFHTVDVGGQAWRVFAARGAEHDVQVFVGERIASRDEILWAVLRGMAGPVLVALPLLALAGGWAVRTGLKPLRTLQEALARRRAEDLQPLDLPGAPAEIARVTAALDALLARIARLLERERRFTGDAAHELRTPIAGILAQAQVAFAASDGEARRRALQATVAGCERAARLVDQLLMLSRLEGSNGRASGPVDLAALVRSVAADLAPQALARGQELQLDAQDDARLHGDEALLGVLARNLVDNAIRHAGDGAHIRIQLRRERDALVLCVEDDGPGLRDEELARLGERFFRAAGQEVAGSGLGWSIAQRIAQAHGGHLQATRASARGGLRACAVLPLVPQAGAA